jgi:type IV pilus assembly protein PilB
MSEWKDIGTLLREYGLINDEDLQEGIRLQKETGLRLGESLARLGKVKMEDIEWVLSKQLDIPFVIVEDITVNTDLLKKFEKNFLLKNRILPLYETDAQISIVTDDPFNRPAIDIINQLFRKKVDISTGSGNKIEDLLRVSFEKVGLPELVAAIRDITSTIRETSFYRIDFLLDENSCRIWVFGSKILRAVKTIHGAFKKEDIYKAYDCLDVVFLYHEAFSDKKVFLSTYPLENRMDSAHVPSVLGIYGLYIPDDITFTDAHVYGTSHFFHSDNPVQGYPFFSTKRDRPVDGNMIFTLDAVSRDFKENYVSAYLPEVCSSCHGGGCDACRDLGHEFKKIEGVYSSDDLEERMKVG